MCVYTPHQVKASPAVLESACKRQLHNLPELLDVPACKDA